MARDPKHDRRRELIDDAQAQRRAADPEPPRSRCPACGGTRATFREGAFVCPVDGVPLERPIE